MDTKRATNFLEFLGTEETNLLVSMNKLRHDVDTGIPVLDGLFQSPIEFIDVKYDDQHTNAIVALYLFTHFHLYFSCACLLRCHLSDSFSSTRKAIDASMSAYRLIEEPASLNDYLEDDNSYQFIKSFIKKKRKEDPMQYPLAAELIELHETCSQYGAHAGLDSFVYRMSAKKAEKENKLLLLLNMFQTPESDIEQRFYFVKTLQAYTQMLRIFGPFICNIANGLKVDEWNTQRDKLQNNLIRISNYLTEQLNSSGK